MVMIKHNLTYGNVSANDHGIYISGEGVYNAPERVVELVSIPGRNGALTIDQGHFDNITIEYPCFTFATSQEEFRRIVNNFKNAMIAQGGYQRLQDDYNPNEYRMALFVEGIEFEPVQYGRACTFTLSFNCKPQRYLVTGEDEVTVSDGDTINNPTLYDAEPLLMVEGYGDIEFNGYHINIENASMGQITLWPNGSVANMVDTLTSTKTIDTSPFNNGDDFSFDLSAQVLYSTPYGVTNKSHSGDGTDTIAVRESSITILDMLEISHSIGTASVVTDTLTVTNANLTIEITLTSSYDGDSTVTLTVNSSRWMRRQNVVLMWSDCVGDSTLLVLGNPTYIDCEIGEAYKYVNGSLVGLNSYIDLGSDLPKLASGNNTFTIDNTITSLQVVPRWWEL